MIQFNLLPDVKKQYIKAKRTKRLITSTSIIISGTAIVVVFLLFSYVQIGQKGHIEDQTNDINKATVEIQSIEDINEMLTVQNQLSLLTGLHESKPETSRIFDYLSQLVPEQAKVTTLDISVEASSIKIRGSADSIATINKLVDTIKIAEYTVDENAEERNLAFSNVTTQLSGENTGASFSIELTYEPVIFDNTKVVKLSIPVDVSTTEAN
jgi:Tfp pilus assembly protein PilN